MDDNDSDSDIEEYSSMEQPPLIKQLKAILAEYPDDGQIIKELLQNAEDAGASEVKILYDDRCINTQDDNKNRYRKFLRGPALGFFNDATFTESDWKGIKMIYSSVKEQDPLKVGRFGLGFKSVFHITDHPVVLSGDRILFMDPNRNPDCVCLTIQLSRLQKWKKLNIDDFFVALDGTFGVSREILKKGFYNGTLLWFPLRSKASSLSDTVYNKEKVMDLFTSFRSEASSILVFLKHLTKVSLHEKKGNTNKIDLQFTVEIVNNVLEVRQLREAFLKKIRNLNKSIPDNSIDCRYNLSFCTKSFDGDRVVEENNNSWKVINYYKGGSMSEELRILIQDDSLGYSPFVGVAIPIDQNRAEFKGHVYCFLPLPQKIKSMTGLPVHVNGFFALSQNRRHIKWPSAEQAAMHLHKDKSLMWNEKLLKEVLPDAYESLIIELINHSVKNGNPDDIVQCVYAAIPRLDQVVDEWNALLPSLFGRIISKPTLMTVNISGEKSWISCSEAFFATFRQYTNLSTTIKPTVIKVLQMYNKRYVDVPLHLFESYSKYNSRLTDMSPHSFAAVLKENPRYKSLSREEKLSVLEFLTLDSRYEILEGLELLPLQDGSLTTFVSRHITSDRVLLCSKEEMGLFPGLEKTFVYQADKTHWIMRHMQAVVNQGFLQIQLMEASSFRNLLEKAIQLHLGPTSPPTVRLFNSLSGSWIQKVWEHIFSHNYGVEYFSHLPLIPLLKSGSWSNPSEMELYQLKQFLIVKQIQNVSSLNEGVYRCLELLSINVLPSLPVWLQVPHILQHIPYSTVSGVIQLLDKLYTSPQRENIISCFNRSCEGEAKKEFVSILAGCTSWSTNSKKFVRCLKLFTEKGSVSRPVSAQENTTVTRVANFPVKFPRPLITGSYDEQRLAFALGATEVNVKQLVIETSQMMQGATYSLSEKQTFMQYFMQNIREFESDRNILNMTSTVYFLESNIMHAICRPGDLFDPLDIRLSELFYGEDRFPAENRFRTNTDIETLKKLGLKTYNDLSATDLYDVARRIETWSENVNERNQMHVKVNRFKEVLRTKTPFLNAYIHGQTLKVHLMNMKCMMHEKQKDRRFPSVLPWFQQQHMLNKPSELRLIKFSTLVGSTMPLIDCENKELAEVFGWNLDPPQNKVVEQLRLLINVYQSSYKPELLPVMKEIYQELGKYSIYNLLADTNFQTLLQNACIWRGDGFSSPHNIFLESKGNDLDLTPYLYKLPEEFKILHPFFLGLGCNKEQNTDVFLKTQVIIKEKYKSGKHSDVDVRRDLSILISILNRLRQEKSKLQGRLHEILFPIHCSDESVLVMKPGSECTYCDAQWLREMASEETDEENIYYVHEDVSNTTAEELGVKSLTQQLLSDTEELVMEEWGQEEPLTVRLHRLLKEGYQDGFSVPKEIVQNADDAGAKRVYFLYDERQNEDAKVNLLDEGMAECQGTALWAYNDAYFRSEDFKNITKLNAATKKDELEKIGKFGLGFCSVYNLTDVPSFISGRNIVIFDPHKSHLGKALPGLSPGMKIDFGKMKNLRMMKRLKNQFKPFQNVFGCNISSDFQGTLFRFPLRTASQAQKSEICDKYYSKRECLDLLDMTIKAAGNLLLFTQHIQEIKIFHLPADCRNPEDAKVIYSMTKEHCQREAQGLSQETVLSQVSKLKSVGELRSRPLKRLQKIIIKENVDHYARSILPSLEKEAGTSVNSSWLIAWATGTDETLKNTFQGVIGALPLCAVAVPFEMENNYFCPVQLEDLPFGFYKSGHLFCFLPLPISCGLPVHINGCFAVTSDRRQLMKTTEDDKKSQRSSWNKALIRDALVNAYIYLLEEIRENSPSPEYEYYALWPLNCPETVLPIRKYFIRKLVQQESRLFHRNLVWQSFHKCIFLDPALRKDKDIGNIAFETLLTFHTAGNSVVMELPDHVMKSLLTYYPNELKKLIISKEQFILDIFLPNIENMFWIQSETNVHKRDKLTMYALEFEHDEIKTSLSKTRCIPSEPNGALKRPIELINPLGILRDMFSENDEVFPRGKETFRQKRIIDRLLILGMIHNYMPFSFLDERCQSVKKIAEICGQCAVERCSKILKYLSGNSVQEKLENTPDDLQKLRNLAFLPVLQKPPRWLFSWKGNAEEHTIEKTCQKNHHPNTVRLDAPLNLFRQCACNLVGCVALVLDETSITKFESSIRYADVCKLLRLKGSKTNEFPYEMVVSQLKTIAQEYKIMQSKDSTNNCKVIMHDIYLFLDRQCAESDQITQACFHDFSNEEVILLGEQMLDTSRVAFNLRHDCSPVLFSLHNTDLAKYKHFLNAIGIKDNFDICQIVRVLEDKRIQCGLNPLSTEDISLVHGLLSVLQDLLRGDDVQYTDLDDDLRRNIVAPDTDMILRETSSLCLDDSEFEAGPGIKTIHGKFSQELAQTLGVKTKRRKYFDKISFLIPGGQKEKLITRLRGILSAYPCDDGIMRELLQNADDARASEIHFIKDYRTHSCEKIFDEKYAPLQGPALCVFNNSAFTKADVEGIHDLGLGSKRDDALKTGQYGVGFNAVYHLTDAPSFLAKGPELENGEMLCIFDPTCQFIPSVTEQNPGVRCLVGDIRKYYPDILKGYLEEGLFTSDVGTMFRFPLRNKKTPKEMFVSPKQVDEEGINSTLKKFCNESFEALLFVKHVTKIIVSNMTSGKLKEEYKVETQLSEDDRRKRDEFFQFVKQMSDRYKLDRTSIIKMPSREVAYTMIVSDSRGASESFYVVQRMGFEDGFIVPQTVVHALKENNLGQLPMGGVAFIIPKLQTFAEVKEQRNYGIVKEEKCVIEQQKESGKAFCFLPLPLGTGLPCHINGHFVLDHEARRSLWKDDQGYRHDWNYCIFESIISPAYISALKYLKKTLFNDLSKHSEFIIRRLLGRFLSYFPLKNVAKEDDWKAIVSFVYNRLYSKEVQVFPILKTKAKTKTQNADFIEASIEWTALQMPGHVFPAFFDHLDLRVSGILKRLGMKIIEIPEIIRKSVEESGIPTKIVNPSSVLSFVKSFSMSGLGICNLKVNVPLNETTFASIGNVRSIVNYIANLDNLETEIENSPLLVTNDGVLRTFSKNRRIICSSFWDLLPSSSEQFVHAELLLCQSQSIWKSGILLKLDMHNFLDLLPSTLPAQVFRNGQDVSCQKSSNQIPNKTWIIRFWQFICDLSVKSTQFGTITFDQVAVKKNIGLLSEWSLLPVQDRDDNFILRPINKAYTIIDLWSFDTTWGLKRALEKLNLPKLDTVLFIKEDQKDILNVVRSLVSTKLEPIEILNCLYYHRGKIRTSGLTPEDCNAVLLFFSNNIANLTKLADESWIRDRIKALALHITQQGTPTSLDENENVFTLPTGMPAEGLDEWATNTGYILLRQNNDLAELHNLLQCTFANVTHVYCSMILPRFDALPQCSHLSHLLYIKDTLLYRTYLQTTFDQTQQQLINVLRSTRFISAGDRMKLASEFYDPYNEVLACMCDKNDFPPSPFKDLYWNEFMKLVGLKSNVSETMFLEFAEALAQEGAYRISENVYEKSTILVNYFLGSSPTSWKSTTIERLAKVKFITPHNVSLELSSLCKQYSESTSLICFSLSTPAHFELLCWTSMNLLPRWACPDPERWKQFILQLGIHLRPPVERAVLHCQKLCDAQNNIFSRKDNQAFDITLFSHIMERVYIYLSEHRNEDPRMKEKLANTPVVFLPNNRMLLPANHIVIDLSKEEAVEPHLYKSPDFYGRYNDLFIFLGASQQVTLNNYCLVLRLVHQMQGDNEEKLLPPEMRIVGHAIRNIVNLLMKTPKTKMDLDEKILYLPNRSQRLMDARALIVSDNAYLESRLRECNLTYFIGFEQLEVKVKDVWQVIKPLPDCYRPKLLSEVVTEEVDTTEMKEIDSDEAERLERFLHSAEFIQGILRLVKHEKTIRKETFVSEDENKIFDQIQGLKIKEVQGLYTYLKINEEIIESSKRIETNFIHETINENILGFTLYFQVEEGKERDVQKYLIAKPNGIIDLIKRCTDNSIQHRSEILYVILDCMHESYNINNIMDKLHIDPYDSLQNISCSIFPRPGTYVPKEFHAFLQQGFSEFQEHEYESVAYELEDNTDGSDGDDSVYIYVRIKRPVKSKEPCTAGITNQYVIDIGDRDKGHVTVYAYKLFKFERKLTSSSQDLLPSDCLPVGSLPSDHTSNQIRNILQEAWTLPKEERRRVLKRLMLRWHPDKNIGQEEYCNQIFNYIQVVVSRLDSGQSLDPENIRHTNSDGRGVFTGTDYEDLGRRVNRTSAQYRMQHDLHADAYYDAHSRRHYTGQSPRTDFHVTDQSNALRWLRQAKKDLSSAKEFLPPASAVPAFNWICYHCHQATEKALKAAVYATDANKVDLRSHQLANIASHGGLGQDLVSLAMSMEASLGHHTRMRYPDSIDRSQIPAEVYTDTQSRTAVEIAEKIIQLVDENYLN
ncbi:hypothetical protein CHS0354_018094 [Potamilus streckersoni]|uniref:HEPN domain-containing protein n=1 Tax=Potamilus streckersoni TaxID=2493646 RepID=A0AAE0WET5_9BIVA|nr:hypothetical protein CHS0354_018094 [Potamilus streckersoni]